MYVANSEPAIWQREGGRAGVRERVLISGESTRSEAGRYMEREYVLPRETLLLWRSRASKSVIKRDCDRRPLKQARTEGGRSAGSTIDSEPMKPGNSVEDKTLTIRKKKIKPECRECHSAWEIADER